MEFSGTIRDGVVVLDDAITIPDGAQVKVVVDESPPSETDTGTGKTIWASMAELARWAETQPGSLPSDLAANHDHYLHNLPKRS